LIGRRDPFGTFRPDIDLTDQGGAEKGVSRQHARIFCREKQVYIEDLESSNGTYVNQQRLDARHEQMLNDRDTIWLGHFKLVYNAPNSTPN
jgi:pSer/pThr/pTyr-binding forkhead associated (FHA) protein